MTRLYRKIIRIKATDSPNVRYALEQIRLGQVPDNKVVLPGILTWAEYQKRLATWDEHRICVGLEADFYEGKEVMLFPSAWLNRAEEIARLLRGKPRKAKGIGCDPAEGGDNTSMAAVDEFGLIEIVSHKTPDTAVIPGELLAFMRKHGVDADRVCIDAGGGGKQHADTLRAQGFAVRIVAFGEALTLEPKRGVTVHGERVEIREGRQVYYNRRSEMYGEASILFDPGQGKTFTLPQDNEACIELRRQLSLIPKRYDGEGRLKMLTKDKRDPNSKEETLKQILGCSPDEADALVLAIFAMQNEPSRSSAGAA